MATHSSILAWRIPWTKEPGRLQSMRSQRIGYDCVTTTSLYFRTQNCPVTTLPRLRNPGPRRCPDSLTALTQSSHGGSWEHQKRGSEDRSKTNGPSPVSFGWSLYSAQITWQIPSFFFSLCALQGRGIDHSHLAACWKTPPRELIAPCTRERAALDAIGQRKLSGEI